MTGRSPCTPPSTNQSNPSATCTSPAVQDPDGGCDLVLDSYSLRPGRACSRPRRTRWAGSPTTPTTTTRTWSPRAASADLTSIRAPPRYRPGRHRPPTPTTAPGNLTSQAVSATSGGGAGTTTTTDYNVRRGGPADQRWSTDATPSPLPSRPAGDSRTGPRRTPTTPTAKVTVADGGHGHRAWTVTDYGYNTAGDETSQTVQDGLNLRPPGRMTRTGRRCR